MPRLYSLSKTEQRLASSGHDQQLAGAGNRAQTGGVELLRHQPGRYQAPGEDRAEAAESKLAYIYVCVCETVDIRAGRSSRSFDLTEIHRPHEEACTPMFSSLHAVATVSGAGQGLLSFLPRSIGTKWRWLRGGRYSSCMHSAAFLHSRSAQRSDSGPNLDRAAFTELS